MNEFAMVIFVTLVLGWFLENLASWFNLRALKQQPSDELAELMDSQQYQKSRSYIQEKTLFSFVSATVSLAALLCFWFLGGFAYVDDMVRQLGLGMLVTGLIFISVLMLAGQILSLPFTLYHTFVLEERFGFNRTTPKTFMLDRMKFLMLFLLLGCPLLLAVLFFFESFATYAWLYAWLFLSTFTFLMQYLAPTYLMPLFNQYKSLEDGVLREKIMTFAQGVDFTVSDIYIMDGSKRSSKANAFFTGFGKHRRIALFDTLLEKLSDDELVAVLAHEIGHYKKKHMLQGSLLALLQTGLMLYVLSLCLETQGLFNAFGVQEISVYAGLVFFSLLYSPVEMLSSLFQLHLSRKNEFEADAFAVASLQQAEPLVSALKKMSVDHLSHQTPHAMHVFLHDSHPPLLARIQAMRAHKCCQ